MTGAGELCRSPHPVPRPLGEGARRAGEGLGVYNCTVHVTGSVDHAGSLTPALSQGAREALRRLVDEGRLPVVRVRVLGCALAMERGCPRVDHVPRPLGEGARRAGEGPSPSGRGCPKGG